MRAAIIGFLLAFCILARPAQASDPSLEEEIEKIKTPAPGGQSEAISAEFEDYLPEVVFFESAPPPPPSAATSQTAGLDKKTAAPPQDYLAEMKKRGLSLGRHARRYGTRRMSESITASGIACCDWDLTMGDGLGRRRTAER